MAWMPGIKHDPQPTHGNVSGPQGVVCHRTYGAWGGDYSVATGGRGSIGFHFLVGKESGQAAQFASTDRICYHAKGANSTTVGIEVTGVNEDVMTPWQVQTCAAIVKFLHDTHGIRYAYDDGARGRHGPNGQFMGHACVAGSDHDDKWKNSDWDRIITAINTGQITAGVPEGPAAPAGGSSAYPGVIRRGMSGGAVQAAQQRLKDRGWRIDVDGKFGPATEAVVKKFQASAQAEGWDTGGVDGVIGPKTHDAMWRKPIT